MNNDIRSPSHPLLPKARRAGVTLNMAAWLAASTLGAAGCGPTLAPESPSKPPETAAEAPREAGSAASASTKTTAFELKPDFEGPCARVDTVDVNLGNTPESFVRAAYCQISGKQPAEALVHEWAARMRKEKHVRRVDVVRTLCKEAGRECKLSYSDPWRAQPELIGAPQRTSQRQIGAVFMFFFNCPGGVNCGMDWASTHAPGMNAPHPLLGFESKKDGHYVASEAGFWRRELLDAEYAGLSFLLLNTYGPDIEDNKLKPLVQALDSLKSPIKIAMMDDTWTWGEPWFSEFWKQKPDLNDPEKAAATIYDSKWKIFFNTVDKRHWYRFKGKPFIYFYNAGKLNPRSRSSALLEKLKARFEAEFGEEPFIHTDSAYFEDPSMNKVADGRFQWFTYQLPGKKSRSTLNGHVIDHAMVRWDSVGRDRPGALATTSDLIVKDEAVLTQVLESSRDAELLILATWNDLGEGTGVNRNYDYWNGERWLEPDHFMRLIRASQSGER